MSISTCTQNVFIIYMKKCEDRSTTEEGGLWRSLRYLPEFKVF